MNPEHKSQCLKKISSRELFACGSLPQRASSIPNFTRSPSLRDGTTLSLLWRLVCCELPRNRFLVAFTKFCGAEKIFSVGPFCVCRRSRPARMQSLYSRLGRNTIRSNPTVVYVLQSRANFLRISSTVGCRILLHLAHQTKQEMI